ncbi:hypothetical protein [Microtetraspora malaysiensis]|uniref:hypothetical protein n=1 Tax=Microtetraspora malaysiensis TaxID=161358 RepID=UPI003D94A566
MSQFLAALIASGTILAIVLATDLGQRRITTMRMLRSVIAVAVVIAIFVHSFPTQGNDLPLQLVGIGTGLIFGLIAGALLPAYRHRSGELYTVGGAGYALVWIVLSLGRVLFAYGAEHWFTEDLVRFSIDYKISGADTYANTFVFMSLAMVLARTASLMTKMRRLKSGGAAVGEEQLSETNAR